MHFRFLNPQNNQHSSSSSGRVKWMGEKFPVIYPYLTAVLLPPSPFVKAFFPTVSIHLHACLPVHPVATATVLTVTCVIVDQHVLSTNKIDSNYYVLLYAIYSSGRNFKGALFLPLSLHVILLGNQS